MKLVKGPEAERVTGGLWRQFLISEIAGEIMLGEVQDHLYVEDLDFKGRSKDKVVRDAVESGFLDLIDDATERLSFYKKELEPYSDITELLSEKELKRALFHMISGHTHCFSSSVITDNPYYQCIKIPTVEKDHILLTMNDYLPGEFIQTYHDKQHSDNVFMHAEAGFFDDKVNFPVLLENGEVWMSLVMSEIESMEEPLRLARGKVITYGLGLGYYAFMAAQKETVDSVTIVEMNPSIIKIFNDVLLPQFPHKEKIHIVQADAFDYADHQADGEYDIAFGDFWSGVEEGLEFYLKFLKKTERIRKTRFDYWIESCFAEYYFRPVLMHFFMREIFGRDEALWENQHRIKQIQKQFEKFLYDKEIELNSAKQFEDSFKTPNVVQLVREFVMHYYR